MSNDGLTKPLVVGVISPKSCYRNYNELRKDQHKPDGWMREWDLQSLIGLAILKSNWDQQHKSYLDNFIPFVGECMRHSSAPDFTSAEIATDVEERFGIHIPEAVVWSILAKASRRGLGERRDGRFIVKRGELDQYDLTATSLRVQREQSALVAGLQEFSRATYGIELTEEGALQALFNYVEKYSLPVLSSIVRGTDVPNPSVQSSPETEYVCRLVCA